VKFPSHKASLTLTHNDHLGVYETVAGAIENKSFGYEADRWVSDEQREKAIRTNECWTLQWYPDTPVGFYALSAADLDVLLAAAQDIPGTENGNA
jgi:hypothetical protein